MYKKSFLAIILIIMLSSSTMAYTKSTLVSSDTVEDRLIYVLQNVADGWESSPVISTTKTLLDFAGNYYTLAEYTPSGYAIYHNSSATVLEKSEHSPSPYYGLNENLYYSGPTHYYVYDTELNKYIHTITGECLDIEESLMRESLCAAAQVTLNNTANTSIKSYVESGVMTSSIDLLESSNAYTYVGNHRSFFENLDTNSMIGYYDTGNNSGYCGYIAAGLVLLYYDYYHNDNFINNTAYLSSSGSSFNGNSFTRYLYNDIGLGTLAYTNELNAVQAARVMQTYLQNKRNITISYWEKTAPSKANVVDQLQQARPVIYCDRWDDPSSPGSTVDHVIVIYGYDSNNNLIAHFGWANFSHVECSSDALALFLSSASAITSYS